MGPAGGTLCGASWGHTARARPWLHVQLHGVGMLDQVGIGLTGQVPILVIVWWRNSHGWVTWVLWRNQVVWVGIVALVHWHPWSHWHSHHTLGRPLLYCLGTGKSYRLALTLPYWLRLRLRLGLGLWLRLLLRLWLRFALFLLLGFRLGRL